MNDMDELAKRIAALDTADVALWGRITGSERWLHETFRLAVAKNHSECMAAFWPPRCDPAPLLEWLPASDLVSTLVREEARRYGIESRTRRTALRDRIANHYSRRIETKAGCGLVALELKYPSSNDPNCSLPLYETLLQLVGHWPRMIEIWPDVPAVDQKAALLDSAESDILEATERWMHVTRTMESWAQAFARAVREYSVDGGDQVAVRSVLESVATVRDLVLTFSEEGSASAQADF